jgi:hypothetical protein
MKEGQHEVLVPGQAPATLLPETVVAFFGSRLRRLEEKAGGTLRCPTCGHLPSMGGIIVHEDGNEPARDPNERCSGCGRHLWTVIRVVYDEPGADFIEAGRGRGDSYWLIALA